MLENDLLEAIIGLPTDMFYNTGISTYIWIVTNRKPEHRKGKVQLIDASGYLAEDAQEPRQQAQGTERRPHRRDHPAVRRMPRKSTNATACPISRIFKNEDFGYQHDHRRATAARRRRARSCSDTKGKRKGKPKPDSNLRDTENVPLGEDVESISSAKSLPHVPDAWIDHDKTKIGYEIPFNRHFYVFKPPARAG